MTDVFTPKLILGNQLLGASWAANSLAPHTDELETRLQIAQRPRIRKGTALLQPLAGRQGVLFSPNTAPNVKLAQSCVHASITLADSALSTLSMRNHRAPLRRYKFCSFDVGCPLLTLESGSSNNVGASRMPFSVQRHRRDTFRVIIQPRTCHLEGVSLRIVVKLCRNH